MTPTDYYAGLSPVELGVKFRSEVSGTITGIRFYKMPGDTSTHTGSLWSSAGTRLATGTFTNETAGGWQQLSFSIPVAISANTTYIASYHTGGPLSYTYYYFQNSGVDVGPLHALKDGVDGPNGVFHYSAASMFPDQTNVSGNYWADVMFVPDGPLPASIIAYSGNSQSTNVGTAFSRALQAKVLNASANPVSGVTVTFTAPSTGASATFAGNIVATAVTDASGIATSLIPTANSSAGAYSVTASVAGLAPVVFSLTNAPVVTGATTTIFGSMTPTDYYAGLSPVELGVKFRSDVSGTITGIRFYKMPGDTSTHTGSLWSSTGTRLATGAFTNETAGGWQQLSFSTPVAISANTTYIASYHTGGALSYTYYYFQNSGVDAGLLHALKDGVDGPNGVFHYSAASMFPDQTNVSGNYWADVLFVPSGSPASVIAYSGNSQSTIVGAAFPSALQIKVTDGSANPVSGLTVNFTAPSSGASATFAGNISTTAVTNASGIATSVIPVANNSAGAYSVTATVAGLTPVVFSLTNSPASMGPTTIFGSMTPTDYYAGLSPVELGVKFRSDVSGTITGIRFYKMAGDTTTHTGSLWSSTGARLATGTFTNETATGWQQLSFSTPVAIAANTTYIASYHTGGPLSYTYYYFQNSGVDAGPLHALKDGVDGPNGVFHYSAVSMFPDQTNVSGNYWADVLFIPN